MLLNAMEIPDPRTRFWRPTNHNHQRRAPWHNYSAPGTYHITITTKLRRPLFGNLIADPIPRIELTSLGMALRDVEINKINAVYPNVHVWEFVIMPDHMHMILNVSHPFPEKKNLGNVIKGFKSGCNNAYWDATNDRGHGIFELGYTDGILLDEGQLNRWKIYLNDNPRRLHIKKLHPNYFTVLHNIKICDKMCQIIGNRFLLNIPDKMPVIVHRKDLDDGTFSANFQKWMDCGERGGVLVSASISRWEKAVMRQAMNRGYRIIFLKANGFPKLYKPGGESFDACARGQLLQICPWDYHFDRQDIKRWQCLFLNSLAEDISKSKNFY